jgi:uncharacterized protein YjiS (DUF1127 family)
MSQNLHYGINHTCTHQQARGWWSSGDALMGTVRKIAHEVRSWIERSRQRRALQDLDDRLLNDIGLSRDEARRECAKLFWQTYARRHLK